MLDSLVSLKDVARNGRRSAESVGLREAETSLVPKSPRGAMTSRRAPRRRRAGPARFQPDGGDLETILRLHAVQSSQLANGLAQTESAMIECVSTGQCSQPAVMTEAVTKLEHVRRSAIEDLRRTAALIHALQQPPVALAARLTEGRAEFAIGPTPARLGPPSEDDLANAYSDGAGTPRALQAGMRS